MVKINLLVFSLFVSFITAQEVPVFKNDKLNSYVKEYEALIKKYSSKDKDYNVFVKESSELAAKGGVFFKELDEEQSKKLASYIEGVYTKFATSVNASPKEVITDSKVKSHSPYTEIVGIPIPKFDKGEINTYVQDYAKYIDDYQKLEGTYSEEITSTSEELTNTMTRLVKDKLSKDDVRKLSSFVNSVNAKVFTKK